MVHITSLPIQNWTTPGESSYLGHLSYFQGIPFSESNSLFYGN